MIESILSVLGYELEAMVCGVGDKILIRGVQKIPPPVDRSELAANRLLLLGTRLMTYAAQLHLPI
jgi:hypothetical protein